jgi:tRNA (cmo5U34)-methyltransferase
MSEAAPGTAWQRAELVGEFLSQRQRLLPLIDVQESLITTIFERHSHPVRRFLDVGAGDGAMSELLLGAEPDSQGVLVDYSEPMLAGAEHRLSRHAGRWRAVRADLREPSWHAQLPPQGFDAAVSALAIHHLDSERKRELFAEVFDLLAPGALFVNMDVVVIDGPLRGLFDAQMAANAVALERERGGPRSADEVEHDLLDDDSDDRPDTLAQQLAWLREAGFEQVEAHFKWAEAAVFGATKPTGG